MRSITKLITFDVTGTLLRPRGGSVGSIYAEKARKFGIDINNEQISALDQGFYKAWKEMNASEPNFGYPTKSSKNWWRSVVFATFSHAAVPLPLHEGNVIFEQLYTEFKAAPNWDVFEEVHPVLRKLKQDYPSIKLGVISNFDERLHDIMRNTSLAPYFDFVLTSREFGIEKPDRRIFQRAIQLAEADAEPKIVYSDVIHIGDHIKKDYEAAKGLGMRAILLVRKESGLEPTGRDQKPNLTAILELLRTDNK